jgi:hypothetical protein
MHEFESSNVDSEWDRVAGVYKSDSGGNFRMWLRLEVCWSPETLSDAPQPVDVNSANLQES